MGTTEGLGFNKDITLLHHEHNLNTPSMSTLEWELAFGERPDEIRALVSSEGVSKLDSTCSHHKTRMYYA